MIVKDMKKIIFSVFAMLFVGILSAQAQAVIKFDKETQNFGTFSEENSNVSTTFTFTNTGDKPLVINQIVTGCGCTTPNYSKEPVAPGKTGTIQVTYNGKGRFPGHFKKLITVNSNAKNNMARIYIEGDMTAAKK